MPANIINGFCDLNIELNDNTKQSIIHALKLGYNNIAVNREITDSSLNSKKSSKNNEEGIPAPITNYGLTEEELKQNGITRVPVILSRLTISLSEISSFVHKYKDVIRKYDIIAYKPLTGAAFKQICQSSLEYDVICFNISEPIFSLPRKLLKYVISLDVYLEISYAPCLRNTMDRRRTIQLSYELFRLAKSKNLFISSGASSMHEIRSPYDVAHLGLLMGFLPAGSKAAVSRVACEAVHCAELRRSGVSKCFSHIENISEKSHNKYSSLNALEEMISDDLP